MKKQNSTTIFIVILLVIGLITALYAADIEATLDSQDGSSGFSIRDNNPTEVFRVTSDGHVITQGNIFAKGGFIHMRENPTSGDRNTNFLANFFYEGMIMGDETIGYGLHLNALPWTWGQDPIYYHAGPHYFYTSNAGGAESEKVRIQEDGKVGIGTTSPDNLLELLSATTPQFRIANTDATDYATFSVDTDGQLDITTVDGGGTGGHICFMPDGNVGVGTTSPASILDVAGAVTLEATTTPSNPSASSEGRCYIKGGKFIIQYNDAGTIRYKYLTLTGTSVTWTHTTTAP